MWRFVATKAAGRGPTDESADGGAAGDRGAASADAEGPAAAPVLALISRLPFADD
jgi:hypothetical protein